MMVAEYRAFTADQNDFYEGIFSNGVIVVDINIINQNDFDHGIFNNGDIVANINLTQKKENNKMLEKEVKISQLNDLKVKYAHHLSLLETENLDEKVEAKLATIKEQITNEVIAEHDNEVAKTNLKLEAINEMIAEVEAEETEEVEEAEEEIAPVEEASNDTTNY